MEKFLVLLSTMFGIGKLPKAPGTWGSFAALGIAIVLVHYISWPVFFVLTALLFPIGVLAADAHAKATGAKDSPEVVIDELVGQWIAIFPLVALDPQLMDLRFGALAAFVLFRLFDIWKPWPVSWAETNIKGGLGVMADDVVAGILAAGVLLGLGYLL